MELRSYCTDTKGSLVLFKWGLRKCGRHGEILDGRNRVIGIELSLAILIAAVRVTSVRWQSCALVAVQFKLRDRLRFRVPGVELKNPSSPEIRNKSEKIMKSPTPGRAPKIRKNTEKIRKRPKNHRFRIFSVFFSYFRGPTRGGGFRNFFAFVSYFRA